MEWNASWIRPAEDLGDVCPVFFKSFALCKPLAKATLHITALGVYEASLNGNRIGEFILAPGWTSYKKRLQYQEYDVTGLLSDQNTLSVVVGKGWYRGRIPGWTGSKVQQQLSQAPAGLLAELTLSYTDGTTEQLVTDNSWLTDESPVRFSEIYDGETYDATILPGKGTPAVVFNGPYHTLIPQQGEEVREQERLCPARIFHTPKGELVVDFGQEVTGYVEITVNAHTQEEVSLSHAEVLDKEGNFYTENYRSAKAAYRYICRDGLQSYKPHLTFFGFRYIRINAFPGGIENAKPENFTAVAVYSNMHRTGRISCSDPLLNRLFDNILWGQKGNFLDVPTDCPQRDERLGWTGDAQVFCRTACFQYDTERFFTKWLADLAADQTPDGRVGHVIPDVLEAPNGSAAWGDAAVICPWEVYLAYGNPQILKNQFTSMKGWVDYITASTTTPNLWTGGEHYGDWLGLDAPSGSYKGSSREDFIASAFYAHSTELVIKAGKVLGEDVAAYESLYQNILSAFRETYPKYTTQTECVLAAHFRLAPNPQAAADQLAARVEQCGVRLETGFVGTPYLLHVLSNYGHTDLAYSLLLRKEYPSWLYPVTKGATTIWEHWDGIMENGDFWSSDMNSFNHYAYGSVADWVFGEAAGIHTVEDFPGYEKIRIAPKPDSRLDFLNVELETRRGMLRSCWKKENGFWKYEIETPSPAVIVIDGQEQAVEKGSYLFFSQI
ncbi:MAG: glycoside hydrolase family 78 protein [Fusicatenibacter sp.]|nr:glycoside hydrolase family 78 protein [Fusicatenibacter sp.]